MAWRKAPPQLVALFDSVIPIDPRVERRQMFGYPAAFADGKLFAGLHQEDFILKLPDQDRERLRREQGAQPFEPMPGRRMREYVVLPEAMLSDRKALDMWLVRSLAYAVSQETVVAKPRAAAPRKGPETPSRKAARTAPGKDAVKAARKQPGKVAHKAPGGAPGKTRVKAPEKVAPKAAAPQRRPRQGA